MRSTVCLVSWWLFFAAPLRADVQLSELMYHPPAGLPEFIEIYNSGDARVDLEGWSFSDGVRFTFPPGTLLDAGERLVVCQDRELFQEAYNMTSGLLLGDYEGALSNGGERVALSDAGGSVVDEVEFSDDPPFDGQADGLGPSLERLCFSLSSSVPGNWRASEEAGGTPLAPNGRSICPPPLPPAQSPVVINEIYYHPPGGADPEGEFIELHNRSSESVDLLDWRLDGGIQFAFGGDGAEIPAGGYLLVAKDPDTLSAVTAIPREEIAGPYGGKLSNFADEVELLLLDRVMDRVEYSQDGLWPAHADGLGSSLQLINRDLSSSLPQNWMVSSSDRCFESLDCTLVDNGMNIRWFENIGGGDPGFTGGVDWFHPDFDDDANGWKDGLLAVGYDTRVPEGQPWVLTPSTAQAGLHSILLRIEFYHDPDRNPCETDIPFLGVDWDDGYVAWLNGVEIARGGMLDPPGTVPAFDGQYRAEIVTAGGFREPEPGYKIQWTGVSGSLRAGRNVLAIGNYNSRSTSSDLYLSARLTLGPDLSAGNTTPGRANNVASRDVLPLVVSAEHIPAEPRSSDPVTVAARVDGPGIGRVDLVYDLGSGDQSIPMVDDGTGSDALAGDGRYTATIPAQPNLTLVKYRIEASSTEPASCPASFPRQGNPSSYTGYLVADNRPQAEEEVRLFYIFTPGALTDLTCAEGVYQKGTFVDFRGRAYFDIGVKFRGETACNYPKKPIRVRFNRGDTFDGQRRLNFNACWNDKAFLREKLGFDLLRDAGVAYCETHLARVHTNGGVFHGAYFTIEDPASQFLRRNGWEPSRPLYKCRTAMLNGSTGGYEPRTDEAEERLGEVGGFAGNLNSQSGQGLIDFLDGQLNVESMIDYQAVQVITIDGDSVVKNWLLYVGPHGRGQSGPDLFTVFAWDIDLSFGQMYLVQDVRHHDIHPLFQTQTYPFVGQGHHGIINALLQRAPGDYYVKAYYGRMWNLLQEKFNPDVFLPKIDRYDENTIETVRDDLQRWPRTWGARGSDPDYWRDDLRAWVQRRYDYLVSYLTGNNPTTGGRRFQYTPAPRLRITEIQYNPDGVEEELEFLEIYNSETGAVDISGWTIPAIQFEFPSGSEAPPGGYLVVSRNPQALAASHSIPPGIPVFGPYQGNLSNGGEELRLRDNGWYRGTRYHPETIDLVNYDDESPWPPEADGEGYSLELRSAALDNDLAGSWQASRILGGTPGTGFLSNLPPLVKVTATPRSGVVPLRVVFDTAGSFDPEGDSFTVHWDFGDGFIGVGPQVTRTFRTPGTYGVTVTLEAERGPSASDLIEILVLPESGTPFVRGDVNADGAIDLGDPIRLIFTLYGGVSIDCLQSADTDDGGGLDLTDAIVLLNFLFLSGSPPPAPFPECGGDEAGGGLDCVSFEPCQ